MRQFPLISTFALLAFSVATAKAGIIIAQDGYITSDVNVPGNVVNVESHNTIADTTADTHTVTVQVDDDPTLNLSEILDNNSGVTYTTYDLTIASLTPGVTAVFSGGASSASPYFQNTAVVNPTDIFFSGALALPDGGQTTLSYTIVITPPVGYHGPISYEITETPGVSAVPEPASLAIFGLGAAALLMRRSGKKSA